MQSVSEVVGSLTGSFAMFCMAPICLPGYMPDGYGRKAVKVRRNAYV
jgi:hypothetical protein